MKREVYKQYIRDRVVKHGLMFIQRDETIRSVAKKGIYSKSTIHKDLVQRLPDIHPELAAKVRSKLNDNISTRHIRGGLKTQEKYRDMKIRARRVSNE
jgi:putative DeoR family transcriptional regulator (stage III sporulation protein D)